MPYNFNLANVLIGAGIFQGILISVVLAIRGNKYSGSNSYLTLALFAAFFHLTYLLFIDFNITAHYSWLFWIPLNYTTAIGPLLYLHTRSKTDIGFSLSKAKFRLFIPVVTEVAFHFFQTMYSIRHGIAYDRTPLFIPAYSLIYLWAGISIFYYTNKSLKLIRNHEEWVLGNYANLKNITLKWLLKFVTFYRWIWICWTPFILLLLLTFKHDIGGLFLVVVMYSLILAVTYLSYFLGLEALIQSQNIHLTRSKSITSISTYSKLSDERIDKLIDKLKRSMTVEKLYKDDQISLSSLSKFIEEEPNLISFILNTHLKKNFYDFVNQYRVEEAKSMMTNPDFTHYKIVSIAYECGFNSKATFNRIFKKYTKMSPSDFMKKHKNV